MSSFNISDQIALEQYLKKQVSEFNRYRLNSSTTELNLEPSHGHEVESDDVREESTESSYKTLFNDTETLVTPKPQTKTSTKLIKSKSSKRSNHSKDKESFINTFIKAIRFK